MTCENLKFGRMAFKNFNSEIEVNGKATPYIVSRHNKTTINKLY